MARFGLPKEGSIHVAPVGCSKERAKTGIRRSTPRRPARPRPHVATTRSNPSPQERFLGPRRWYRFRHGLVTSGRRFHAPSIAPPSHLDLALTGSPPAPIVCHTLQPARRTSAAVLGSNPPDRGGLPTGFHSPTAQWMSPSDARLRTGDGVRAAPDFRGRRTSPSLRHAAGCERADRPDATSSALCSLHCGA